MIVILKPNIDEVSANYQDAITFLENCSDIHYRSISYKAECKSKTKYTLQVIFNSSIRGPLSFSPVYR